MNPRPLPPPSPQPENTPEKQPRRGGWRKGVSGNPAGKPKGARHQALIALELVGQESALEIMQSVVAAAKAGDMTACRILLDRLWPPRKGRPIHLDLPVIKTGADLAQALSAVVTALGAGQLTPEEAASVSAVLEVQRRAIELGELEARIAALEAAAHAKHP